MIIRNIRGKPYDLKRCLHLCLWILVMNFGGIMTPTRGLAWFHHPSVREQSPVLDLPQSRRFVSDTYLLLHNRAPKGSNYIYRESPETATMASAGRIKINIPFNLLSKTVINPQALLDRQIAANLRVRNILEQYLSMKKRNAVLLKDLRIPYLEGDDKEAEKRQAKVSKKIAPAHEMKQKMAEVIFFQRNGRNRQPDQGNPDFQAIWAGDKKDNRKALSYGGTGKSSSGKGAPAGGRRPLTPYGDDTEWPWIFAFGLTVFRYLVDNKIEILIGAVVMAMVGLIGVLVIKR